MGPQTARRGRRFVATSTSQRLHTSTRDVLNAAAAGWLADNMTEDIDLTEVRFGEIAFSTTLGVSTKAGATV